MSNSGKKQKSVTGGGFKAIQYVMSCANQVGPRKLAAAVRSNNTCKACAFGTGGQRGGLHNEYSNRIEICNKNIQAQLGDIRDPIPDQIFEQNNLEELRQLTGKQLEDLGRLAHPLHKKAGADHYELISYQQAFEITARKILQSKPQRSFFYASGRSSNEAAFLLQLFARIYGSNHVNNCSYYCHQASGVGLSASIGTGTATIQYQDLHKADLVFVFGANPASNHPRFVKTLIECRQRGGKVIVVNPAKEAGLVRFASPSNFRSMIAGGTDVASMYIQPHIGGDVAFMSGVARKLIELEALDMSFIDSCCNGFDEYREFLEALSWEQLEQISGVSQSEMEAVANQYAAADNVVFSWGMGMTHHRHGTDNVEAIANLALLRGMIGGPGKGLLPLRGHSNVQGVGSMGFTPALKEKVFKAIESNLSVKLPRHAGMDTLSCLQAAASGEVDFAFLLGGNLYSATPDSVFADRALSNIPFKIMLSSSVNQTHLYGIEQENIILPVRVRDEETQPTTQESMFNFVRMSDGGFDRIKGLLSEIEIITAIAEQVVDVEKFDFKQFRQHSSIRKAIANLIPGFESMAQIDDSKAEFHIRGRYIDKPGFPTADGKANFRLPSVNIFDNNPANETVTPGSSIGNFTLTTVRSEGQFNTIIYNENDTYRRQTHRQVLFMNPRDIADMAIEPGQYVDVFNETGEMTNLQVQGYEIRKGNVMVYFPEANVLVPQVTDTRSRTPAFKSVDVCVRPSLKS